MNRRLAKKIGVFIIVALFILPSLAKAQIQTRYEQTPTFSQEELAQVLAPIALYPDALLSQILIAASYPYEVAEADRWLARNPYLTDEQLDEALQAKDWDVSVLSLCYYPKVLSMMAENLNWTARLGDAFVYQQQDVMDTIQDLRARAAAQGNLNTTDEQKVIVEERIIRIEPAYYNYLYVPVYDPFVVYGPWWFPAFLPFRIFYPGVVVTGPRIVFSPRLFVSFGVIGWSHFDWHSRHIIIRDIDRTRKFNRHYQVYHRPQEKIYWKPNQQKRVVYERRRQEQPRFRQQQRSPGSTPSGGFKRGADVVVPPRSKAGVPAAPPAVKRDQRPVVTPKDPGSSPASKATVPRGKETQQGQPQLKHQPSGQQPSPTRSSPKGQEIQSPPRINEKKGTQTPPQDRIIQPPHGRDNSRNKAVHPPAQQQPIVTQGAKQESVQRASGSTGRGVSGTPRSANKGFATKEEQNAERGMQQNMGNGRMGGRDSRR
ncbi:MAG TPA: DUF3300 domain-containing protein [Smithellaceae bacterium]|nr:DUF3300 domain-containing protein [Smithellaceae bacterium]HRS89916.1 DUF3300 domain-containing protein [Smithellaceae bacterium]HRV26685.1 DUF3300 domain-containing protein [Smithellaceae bacterium]